VRFIIGGTIEERILKLQDKKRAVFEGTVGKDASALVRTSSSTLTAYISWQCRWECRWCGPQIVHVGRLAGHIQQQSAPCTLLASFMHLLKQTMLPCQWTGSDVRFTCSSQARLSEDDMKFLFA
jgi:hypothetical protein